MTIDCRLVFNGCENPRMCEEAGRCIQGGQRAVSISKDQNAPARRKLVYLGGSMSNREGILAVAKALDAAGFDAFIDWIYPGEETDVKWREFSLALGMDYEEALCSPHAHDVYEFDRRWLDRADAFILVGPAGKSAHLELGYMAGKGKPAFLLLPEQDPDRWDVMVLFATMVTKRLDDIILWLRFGS